MYCMTLSGTLCVCFADGGVSGLEVASNTYCIIQNIQLSLSDSIGDYGDSTGKITCCQDVLWIKKVHVAANLV